MSRTLRGATAHRPHARRDSLADGPVARLDQSGMGPRAGGARGDVQEPASLLSLRSATVNAAAHAVTMLAASGDSGSANVGLDVTTGGRRTLFARPEFQRTTKTGTDG